LEKRSLPGQEIKLTREQEKKIGRFIYWRTFALTEVLKIPLSSSKDEIRKAICRRLKLQETTSIDELLNLPLAKKFLKEHKRLELADLYGLSDKVTWEEMYDHVYELSKKVASK
jgi:hypothetical protein